MSKIILIFFVLFFAETIIACECDIPEISDQEFKDAKNIFLFRVRSTQIIEGKDTPIENGMAVGAIRIVENYKGTAHYSSIQYSTSYCCGSKFEIGNYYLAVVDKDGKLFRASPTNTIHFGKAFELSIGQIAPYANLFRDRIMSAVNGSAPFSKVFPTENRRTTSSVPPPPPPPPPPCFPDKKQS
jgi:hypothetical protein